jgi:hypothetical protein
MPASPSKRARARVAISRALSRTAPDVPVRQMMASSSAVVRYSGPKRARRSRGRSLLGMSRISR